MHHGLGLKVKALFTPYRRHTSTVFSYSGSMLPTSQTDVAAHG
jgi:hypothetical protein